MLIDTAFAATIHGTIYDISLKKVNDVSVEINTQPKQFIVSKDGTYSFNVPIGDYKIKAEYFKGNILDSSVEENLSVIDDGDYILDLILFPNFDEEELSELDIGISLENDFKVKPNYIIYFLISIIIIISIIIYFYKKRKKFREDRDGKEEEEIKQKILIEETGEEASEDLDEDLNQLVKIIKEEGGRTTQKEIRKKIPLSEAKISLLMADLEDKGLIKKVKKGRGNIIILKKNKKH
jgi:uncharacterized membrane protein